MPPLNEVDRTPRCSWLQLAAAASAEVSMTYREKLKIHMLWQLVSSLGLFYFEGL